MALRVHERHGALETRLPRVPRSSLAPSRGPVDLCYPATCFRRYLSILGSISGSLMLRLVACSQTAALDGFAVDRGLTSGPLTKMRATSHHAHNFVAHKGAWVLCCPANCFRRYLSILESISGSLMLRLVGCSQTAALAGFAVDCGLTPGPFTKMRATSHHAHNSVAHINKELNISIKRKSFAYL